MPSRPRPRHILLAILTTILSVAASVSVPLTVSDTPTSMRGAGPTAPPDEPTTMPVEAVFDTVWNWYGGIDSTGAAFEDGVWDFEDGTLQGWTSRSLSDVPPMWRYDAAEDTANVLLPGGAPCWPGGSGYGNYWRQSLLVDGPTFVSFDYETDSEYDYDFTYVYLRDTVSGTRNLLATYTGGDPGTQSESGTFSRNLSSDESLEILFSSDPLFSDGYDILSFYHNSTGGFRMSNMQPASGWYAEASGALVQGRVESLANLSPQPASSGFAGNVLLAADPQAATPHPTAQAEVFCSNPIAIPHEEDWTQIFVQADQFMNTPAGAAPVEHWFGIRVYPAPAWLCRPEGGLWSPIEYAIGYFQEAEDSDDRAEVPLYLPSYLSSWADADSIQIVLSVFSACDFFFDDGPCDFTAMNATPYFDNIRLGFRRLYPKEIFFDATLPPMDDDGDGRAAAWSDYDGDGDDDVFVANASTGYRLFQRDAGGTFTDATGNLPVGSAQGGVWGDFDEDGDPDLYVVRDGANTLLVNDGGVFTEGTTSPLDDTGDGRAAAAGDYDGDGDLDLFLANGSGPDSRLFRYEGPGWVDVTPVAISVPAEGASWGDYDDDGDLDLLISRTDFQAVSLYRNDGGDVFVSIPISAVQGTVGIWADVDSDGDLDIVTSWGNVHRNQGNDVFEREGMATVSNGTSISGADFDLDGDIDFYLTQSLGSVNTLIVNHHAGEDFYHFNEGAVLDTGDAAGATWSDHDGDGDPDIYLVNDGSDNVLLWNFQESVPRALRGPNSLNALGVRPLTAAGAPAIGARVRVVAGGQTQIRDISGGSANGFQDAPVAQFGLGEVTVADSVVVTWPSGELSIQVDVAANQTVEVPVPVPTLALGQAATSVDIPIDAQVDLPLVLKNTPLVAPPLLWSVSDVCGYVSLLPLSGTLTAGDSAVVVLSINMAGLGETEVTCDIVVTSNDPSNPEVIVPVTVSTRPNFRPAQLDAVHALVDTALTILETDGASVTATTIGGTSIIAMDNLVITRLGEIYATAAFTTLLYRLDGETGASVSVGNLGFDVHGLAVDDTDAMWAVSSTGDLYEIDPTVPSTVLVGSTGLGQAMFTAITGLGFDHTTDRLVVLESQLFVTGVYEVDRATANVQLIASSDRGLSAITFDTDGQAFVGDNIEYKSLDMGTGDTTLLGTVPAFINALAAWPSATAVDVPEATSYTFAVRPAAPNPFNPHTRIAFDMAERGHARVDVFDAHGRRVAVLTDRVYGPGRHDVRFDAAGLGSGVYFYRVALPGVVETRKMTLLK